MGVWGKNLWSEYIEFRDCVDRTIININWTFDDLFLLCLSRLVWWFRQVWVKILNHIKICMYLCHDRKKISSKFLSQGPHQTKGTIHHVNSAVMTSYKNELNIQIFSQRYMSTKHGLGQISNPNNKSNNFS